MYGVYFSKTKKMDEGICYYDNEFPKICINERLIISFLRPVFKDTELIRTINHEMNHMLIGHNTYNGQIDFFTFLFLEERLIRKFDYNYYGYNYDLNLEEAECFTNEILETNRLLENLDYKKKLNLDIYYMNENNLYKETFSNSRKIEIHLGDKILKIPIEEYIGEVIKRNNHVLDGNFRLLKIKYNDNGNEKSVKQLLNDFYNMDETKLDEYGISYDNLYSIYYGILKRKTEISKERLNEKEKKSLKSFFSMNMVSIQSVMINQNASNRRNIKESIGRTDYTDVLNKIKVFER